MRCKKLSPPGRFGSRFRALATAAAVAAFVLSGCYLQSPMGTQESEAVGVSPRDSSNDIPRVYAASAELGGFDYETMPPVAVILSFIDSAARPIENVVATLETTSGARVYRGRSDAEGLIEAEVRLPSKPEDIKLTAERPGFQPRSVVIKNMVRYETIDRTLELTVPEGSLSARSGGGMLSSLSEADSDGDGVPDALDDFPNDATRAFRLSVPAEGTLTVVFEDLFPNFTPDFEPGTDGFFDADFNDFVAEYAVEEITNSENVLVEISGKVKAVQRLAGYEHRFGMLFRFDGHSAELTVERPGYAGTTTVSDLADIELFENSRRDLGKTATFTIAFHEPVPREEVTAAPYDPYIYVHDTGKYIHRIGKDPHPDADPPKPGGPPHTRDWDQWRYRHPENGMPWALIIPETGWQYPGELVFIEEVYPAFLYWRESFGDHYPDWYTYYREDPGPPPAVEPPPPITGISRDRDGVTLSGDPPGDTVEYPGEESYTLHLEDNVLAGTVYYRSVAPLPVWIGLEEEDGIVTVDTEAADLLGGETKKALASFYSSYNAAADDDDAASSTIEEPFAVEFAVTREVDPDI